MTDDEKIKARLDNLKGRLDDVSDKRHRKEASVGPTSQRRQSIGKALRLGTEFVAGVAVGGFIGFWIDRLSGMAPIWFIVFFLLGIAAGFLNVFRTAKQIQEEQAEQVSRGELNLGRDLPDDDDD
jgi:ATP synthase protein I